MKRKLFIVAAHPDDEVLGCFGTVAKLIRSGWEAYTLILSKGKRSRGATDESELEQLHAEMVRANESIGVKQVFQYDLPDNAFDSVPLLDIVQYIEGIKNRVSPELVFTHHVGDMNIDHQITHRAVLTATRPMADECVKAIYAMEVPSSTEWNAFSPGSTFVPNVFVNIQETMEIKVNAMACYTSELRDYPHPRSLEHLRQLARTNGAKVGLPYSENFMLIRKVIS